MMQPYIQLIMCICMNTMVCFCFSSQIKNFLCLNKYKEERQNLCLRSYPRTAIALGGEGGIRMNEPLNYGCDQFPQLWVRSVWRSQYSNSDKFVFVAPKGQFKHLTLICFSSLMWFRSILSSSIFTMNVWVVNNKQILYPRQQAIKRTSDCNKHKLFTIQVHWEGCPLLSLCL